ncbi:hypothetical protein LINGRAHAP2_LOCUS30315 [Linum grandiflorum]
MSSAVNTEKTPLRKHATSSRRSKSVEVVEDGSDEVEENPVESDPKRQKVEDDGSTKLLLEDVDKDEDEKFQLYIKRMKETDGFDLGDLPLPRTLCGGVLPVDIDSDAYVLTTTSPLVPLICHPNQKLQKSMKLGSGIGGMAVRKLAFFVRKAHLNKHDGQIVCTTSVRDAGAVTYCTTIVGKVLGDHIGAYVMIDEEHRFSKEEPFLLVKARVNISKPLKKDKKIWRPGGEWLVVTFQLRETPNIFFTCGSGMQTEVSGGKQTQWWSVELRAPPKKKKPATTSRWLVEEPGGVERGIWESRNGHGVMGDEEMEELDEGTEIGEERTKHQKAEKMLLISKKRTSDGGRSSSWERHYQSWTP